MFEMMDRRGLGLRLAALGALLALGGCQTWLNRPLVEDTSCADVSAEIYFQPDSADLGPDAQQLIQAAAANRLGERLAAEGLDRAMWAGPKRSRDPVRIVLGVTLAAPGQREGAYRYEVEVGFPQRVTAAAFDTEPQVKIETLSYLSGSCLLYTSPSPRDRG